MKLEGALPDSFNKYPALMLNSFLGPGLFRVRKEDVLQ